MSHIENVRKFMKLAGQDTPEKPDLPPYQVLELRARLHLEECLETLEAMGFEPVKNRMSGNWQVKFVKEPNLIQICDGCADTSVVTVGTMIASGVDFEPILQIVDESNMTKFEGGHMREDGKWMKPKDWLPPTQDIVNELLKQGLKK